VKSNVREIFGNSSKPLNSEDVLSVEPKKNGGGLVHGA